MKLYFCLSLYLKFFSMYFALFCVLCSSPACAGSVRLAVSLDSIVLMSRGDTLSEALLKANVRHFSFLYSHLFFCRGFSLVL